VFFWRPLGDIGPREIAIGVPYESEAYELTDARDVEEALSWAQMNADNRIFTLYAVHDRGSEHGLIRQAGVDPTVARITHDQAASVRKLFAAHGYNQEPLMHPITIVDERAFVVETQELRRIADVEGLVAELEHLLGAPVRIEAQ
jgi:hypothetical protein